MKIVIFSSLPRSTPSCRNVFPSEFIITICLSHRKEERKILKSLLNNPMLGENDKKLEVVYSWQKKIDMLHEYVEIRINKRKNIVANL